MSRLTYVIYFVLAVAALIFSLKLAGRPGILPIMGKLQGISIGIITVGSYQRLDYLNESTWPVAVWAIVSAVVMFLSLVVSTKQMFLLFLLYLVNFFYVVTLED